MKFIFFVGKNQRQRRDGQIGDFKVYVETHSMLKHDDGVLVGTSCRMEWESWKLGPEELKKYLRDELVVNANLLINIYFC